MENLLKKYDIRSIVNEKFMIDINYYDVCTKLFNINIINDHSYISEDEFIEMILDENNCQDIAKKFYQEYSQIIKNIPDEIIKPLARCEKNYNISSSGYIISKKTGKILEQHFLGKYYAVDIYFSKKRNDHKDIHVHVLLAETFLEKPIDTSVKYIVDHINGIKTDNRLENLRYLTCSGNSKSAYLTGNSKAPSCLIVCKLDNDGNVLERYESIQEAARQNNISASTICCCCKGKILTAGGFGWRYSKKNIKKEEIDLFDDEIFKPIPNINGLKFSRYESSNYGKIRNIETGLILKNKIMGKGYEHINLYPDNGKAITLSIHRIVGYTFLKIPENAKILRVNHIDENPRNNYFKNLEWLTSRKNTVYSLGKQVHQINIKNDKILLTFDSIRAAGRFVGKEDGGSNIAACCRGKVKTVYGYKWKFADEEDIIEV